ncbi:hypothetical protein RRG08_009604 [Elysia crispata]|uniref:Uncharacterized protein n=1 Tax=Elysia crispata TaxID=231223 RepID=A0AAE1CLQ6_9GAST|nr:hypothetical protein RRG08_009604 [Elysia crispata]
MLQNVVARYKSGTYNLRFRQTGWLDETPSSFATSEFNESLNIVSPALNQLRQALHESLCPTLISITLFVCVCFHDSLAIMRGGLEADYDYERRSGG